MTTNSWIHPLGNGSLDGSPSGMKDRKPTDTQAVITRGMSIPEELFKVVGIPENIPAYGSEDWPELIWHVEADKRNEEWILTVRRHKRSG